MKRKFLYILLVLVTLIISLAGTAEFPRFLLAFELLFALTMAIWVRWMAGKLKISLTLTQKSILKGDTVGVQVHVKNPAWLPAGEIRVELRMRDLSGWQTEEKRPEKYFTVYAGADRRGTDCWKTEIRPVHCGLIHIEITEVRIFDYIGLCSVRLRGPFNGRYVSVVPHVYPLKLSAELEQAAGRDGWQEDVAAKPGSDTQEIFDTRFYQRGDTLHNIHWKLSAKADDLMVKEFSMPVDTAFYIVADCESAEPSAVRPDQIDRFLETTAAVAGHCISRGNPCELLWYSAAEEVVQCCRIESEEDLYQAMEELLGICPCQDSARLQWQEAGIVSGDDEMLRIALDGTAHQGRTPVQLELLKTF